MKRKDRIQPLDGVILELTQMELEEARIIEFINVVLGPYGFEITDYYKNKIKSYNNEYSFDDIIECIKISRDTYLVKNDLDKFLDKLGGILYYQTRPLLYYIYRISNCLKYKISDFKDTEFIDLSNQFFLELINVNIKDKMKTSDFNNIESKLIHSYFSFFIKGRIIGFPDDWFSIEPKELLKNISSEQYYKFSEFKHDMLEFLNSELSKL